MTDVTERKQGQGSRKSTVPEYHTDRKRTKVRQYRSKLAVKGKDPNFEYRWVLDTKDSGAAIMEKIEDDWVLVHAHEVTGVGEDNVFKSEFAGGSIVRRLAGSAGNFYYLMKIRKDWYEEDQAEKAKEIDDREDIVLGRNTASGESEEDTYDAISGVRGQNKPSRITGVAVGKHSSE
jgi:hypothetical protein